MTVTEVVSESLELAIRGFIEKILEDQPIGEIMEKTGFIDLAIAKAKDENKNIRNIFINQQSSELDENSGRNFFHRKSIANSHLGKAIIEKIIEIIPSEYTKLLSEQFADLGDTISRSLENPTYLASDLVRDQLNKQLEDLKTPFLDIVIDDLEIIPKRNYQELKCSFNFTINEYAPQIIVKISAKPQLGQNPIMQLIFQIEGEINLYDVAFSNTGELEVSFGEFDLNLNIKIEEMKLGRTAIPIGENNVLYTLSMNKIKEKITDYRTTNN